MCFIEKTAAFDKWFRRLKDLKAKAKILFKIQKLERDGHFGDCKVLGGGIKELRIHFAKGYRIYIAEKKTALFYYWLAVKNQPNRRILKRLRKFGNH